MEQIITFINQQSDLFLFTQAGFWVFFGVVLGIHSFIYKKRVARSTFLFLASLFFYFKTGGYFFTLLIISTLTDYTIGLFLGRVTRKIYRKGLLMLSLVINLGLLGYFKYTYFIIEILEKISFTSIERKDFAAVLFNHILGTQFDISSITLPVGISFFTFQTISYTFDVYRRQVKPVTNIIDFGFYVSFFPQLIAGPIVRAKTFIPQIYQTVILSERWIWQAILLIMGGLFKKMVISDYLSVNLVDRVFEHPITYSGFEVVMAIYGYALQIYCDFSGYTDIALGAALLLGFRLPTNFNFPYKAISIQDFWRRWHISLSSWLRDYLYIPLGGSRKGAIRTSINLLLTMLLGGLWHGASLKFIIWGGLHGIALIVNKGLSLFIGRRRSIPLKIVGWFVTFHFVIITWIIFRVDSLENAEIMMDRIAWSFLAIDPRTIVASHPYLYSLIALGFIMHFLPLKFTRAIKLRFLASPAWLKIIIASFSLYIIILLHQSDLQPFIYFRF